MEFKLLLATLFSFVCLNAQVIEQENTNTIEDSFKTTYAKAINWKEYKMIKRTDFIIFQKKILDSVSLLKKDISLKLNKIDSNKNKIKSLHNKISTLNEELTKLKGAKENEKNTKFVLFFTIGILLLALIIFIIRFQRSNVVNTKIKSDLIEIEEEFEDYRKKSLEKEQRLRRQLQDEINKQRGI